MRYLFILFLLFSSCDTLDCEDEKIMFSSSWTGVVQSIYKDPKLKATQIIKFTNGDIVRISPTQDVIVYSRPGDSLVKIQNSLFCQLFRDGAFKRELRLTSITCDSLINE